MVDPESVRRRLRELDRRSGLLRAIVTAGRERYMAETALQAQAERHLQLALQSVIDAGLHIVAEDTGETPEEYGQAFRLLARHGVLGENLAERLRLSAGLRNVLVHGYLDVDPERVWEHLGRLGDLEDFARAVSEYLEDSDV